MRALLTASLLSGALLLSVLLFVTSAPAPAPPTYRQPEIGTPADPPAPRPREACDFMSPNCPQ